MTPQVQILVHLDPEDNAASLAVKLQDLIRKVRQGGAKAYGFVIWTDPNAKDKIAKLAEDKKIEDIALCYLPDKQRDNYLRLLKIEPSEKLRNVIFVYRNKRLTHKFVNLDAKDFAKVEEAMKAVINAQ